MDQTGNIYGQVCSAIHVEASDIQRALIPFSSFFIGLMLNYRTMSRTKDPTKVSSQSIVNRTVRCLGKQVMC